MRLALFNTSAPERKHGGVAAIVQDHVAGLVARTPIEDALYIIPIFLKGLTLYGENGNVLILDARYEKVREGGVVGSLAVLIAIGIDWEGRREIPSVAVANRESAKAGKET